MVSQSPGGQGDRRRRAASLAALGRLSEALVALYSRSSSCRYASEMWWNFWDLSREGLEEGTEAAKEKELLEALRRLGKLTVAGVALETSLSVEEADWMLSALAAKGHLEVRVEHGRLLYSIPERDDPL
jgi:hypothetical protein